MPSSCKFEKSNWAKRIQTVYYFHDTDRLFTIFIGIIYYFHDTVYYFHRTRAMIVYYFYDTFTIFMIQFTISLISSVVVLQVL